MIILIKTDTHLGKFMNPPWGVIYLGGALKRAGFEVEIIHCIPEKINETVEKVISEEPLFVGFSVITGPDVLYSAMASKEIKKNSDTPIVWGGIHPSLLPEQCIKEDYIDMVVTGEGEETVVEIAQRLEDGSSFRDVKGIGFKEDGKIHFTESRPFIKDLDQYRIDFELVDLTLYIHKRGNFKRAISYISSRGCPHNCGFCYNTIFNKRRWRPFSIDVVLEDVEFLKEKYGIDVIFFWDDNFYVNIKRAFKILEKIDIPGYTEVRIDYLKEDVVKRLPEVNCMRLLIGAESGSDRILKLINKGFRVKDIKKSVKLLAKYHIHVNYSFILGFPTEQPQETQQTIDLMRYILNNHNEASFTVGFYMPYPGTTLYDLAQENGFIPPGRTEDWHIFDRWKDELKLPWIDTTFVKNLRGYFFYVSSGATPFRKVCKFRINHNFYSLPFDLRVYEHLVDSNIFTRDNIASIPIMGGLINNWLWRN